MFELRVRAHFTTKSAKTYQSPTSGIGFYRVFYSEDLLENLLSAVENGQLGVDERLVLIDDLAALSAAGKIPARQLMDILQRYK